MRNLKYMAKFAATYPEREFEQTVSAQIPWSYTIVFLLCKSKNDLVAEYALKDMSKPMGASAYKVTSSLPEELQQLSSIEDIEKRIQKE